MERYYLELVGLKFRCMSKRVENHEMQVEVFEMIRKASRAGQSEFPEVWSKEYCSLSMLGSKQAPHPHKFGDLCMPCIQPVPGENVKKASWLKILVHFNSFCIVFKSQNSFSYL